MEIFLHCSENIIDRSARESCVELSALSIIGKYALYNLKSRGKSLDLRHIELICLKLFIVDLFLLEVFFIGFLLLVEFLQRAVEFVLCLLIFIEFCLVLGKVILVLFKGGKILIVFFLIRKVSIICLLFLVVFCKLFEILLSRLECRRFCFVIVFFLFKEYRLIVCKVYIGVYHICADIQSAGVNYGKCLAVACSKTGYLSLICTALCGICEICGLPLNGRGGGGPGDLSARRGKLVFRSTYGKSSEIVDRFNLLLGNKFAVRENISENGIKIGLFYLGNTAPKGKFKQLGRAHIHLDGGRGV